MPSCSRVAAIAVDLGFADQSHFTRVFARIVGIAPGRYARRVRTCCPSRLSAISFKNTPAARVHHRAWRRAPVTAREQDLRAISMQRPSRPGPACPRRRRFLVDGKEQMPSNYAPLVAATPARPDRCRTVRRDRHGGMPCERVALREGRPGGEEWVVGGHYTFGVEQSGGAWRLPGMRLEAFHQTALEAPVRERLDCLAKRIARACHKNLALNRATAPGLS